MEEPRGEIRVGIEEESRSTLQVKAIYPSYLMVAGSIKQAVRILRIRETFPDRKKGKVGAIVPPESELLRVRQLRQIIQTA